MFIEPKRWFPNFQGHLNFHISRVGAAFSSPDPPIDKFILQPWWLEGNVLLAFRGAKMGQKSAKWATVDFGHNWHFQGDFLQFQSLWHPVLPGGGTNSSPGPLWGEGDQQGVSLFPGNPEFSRFPQADQVS